MEPMFGSIPVFKESPDTLRLPDEKEMRERLFERGPDSTDLRERFYPLLLRKGGQSLTPDGLVLLLSSALDEYSRMQPPPSVSNAGEFAEEYIRALTPRAKDLREKTITHWRVLYGKQETTE